MTDIFWSPKTPSIRIEGTFQYRLHGAAGLLTENKFTNSVTLEKISVIFRELNGKDKITLFDVSEQTSTDSKHIYSITHYKNGHYEFK